MLLDTEILKILACPSCHGALSEVDGNGNAIKSEISLDGESSSQNANTTAGLLCASCSRVYPVQDNVPVLLKEAGVRSSEWPKGHIG